MKQILAEAKNLSDLLGRTKFSIDYYQREYGWARKHVEELLNDLVDNFYNSYEDGHNPSQVEGYDHYFLGSIIISNRNGQKFIIDGQQRLTSLTLLLIHIYHRLSNDGQKRQIAQLSFSEKYRRRSFNLDVQERIACMDALFNGRPFPDDGQEESVVNILHRSQDVTELVPGLVPDSALPFFANWLIYNVYLVEITANSDADAYTIFETMNDRGLSLAPADMLKGYLLANIDDPKRRDSANQLWRTLVTELRELSKDEEADAIKAWLRSKYAKTIREKKRGAKPRDFDRIGNEFRRWMRDKKNDLALFSSDDFYRFIENFNFFGRWYRKVRCAAENRTEGLEAIYYCARHKFTLQYPVLLAPLRREDSDQELLRKLRITAAYLDILIARRIWNWRAISHSNMRHAMFSTMREIRDCNASTLSNVLTSSLGREKQTFAANDRFRLNRANGPNIHRLLARLTDYVETSSGRPSLYTKYIRRGGKRGYEIEHIWADNFQRHTEEFEHLPDFLEYRNRIGGLLLLPKRVNASFGDLRYEEKRKYYLKQNLLAQSLHESAYERDPGFNSFIRDSKLPFRPHHRFRRDDLDARSDLYRRLAEAVWDPKRLAQAAEA